MPPPQGRGAGSRRARRDSGALEEFLGDGEVALRPDGLNVVEQNGLTEAGGFRQPDVPGNYGPEHPMREVLLGVLRHLPAQIQARVVHREQDAVDREGLVEILLHHLDGVEQLRNSLERVVLALDGDEHPVRGGQHVQRDQSQGWRAVDDDDSRRRRRCPPARGARPDSRSRRSTSSSSAPTRSWVAGTTWREARVGVREDHVGEPTAINQRVVERPANWSRATPTPLVALPCGSASTSRTRFSAIASAAERLTAVVVLPTPPFWFAIAMTRAIVL